MEWTDGYPVEFKPGQMLDLHSGGMVLIGDCNQALNYYSRCDRITEVVRWCQLIDVDEVRRNEYATRAAGA